MTTKLGVKQKMCSVTKAKHGLKINDKVTIMAMEKKGMGGGRGRGRWRGTLERVGCEGKVGG